MRTTPFLETLFVASKASGIVPFHPNSSQRLALAKIEEQLDEIKMVRAIILKSRQIGMSTLAEGLALLFEMCFPPLGGLVIAQDNRTSRDLLEKTKLMWNTWPLRERFGNPRYATRSEMHWRNGSRLVIHSAKEVHSTRGITAQVLHCSEVAFWPDPREMMKGLLQGVPHTPKTMVLMESTANGVGGFFYDFWQAAVEGENEYVAIFIPWFLHEEYESPSTARLGRLDDEEKVLAKLMARPVKVTATLTLPGLTDTQIADKLRWRRWKIEDLAGDVEGFHQEYPSSPEEAFVSAGVNIFPLTSLQACYSAETAVARGELIRDTSGRPAFSHNPDGPMKLYRRPADSGVWAADPNLYMVAGDPTFTTENDPAVIQVINRRSMEQVAVWEQKIDPISFAEELAKMGHFYNHATVTCEIEGPGYGTIGRLAEIYDRIWQHHYADRWKNRARGQQLGWSTNRQRKEYAIGWTKKLVNDRSLILHDPRTFNQLRDYVNGPDGMGPADPNGHDDHVMALAIALACHAFEGPLAPLLTVGPRRDIDLDAMEQFQATRPGILGGA